jgi:hypothetical protein
VLREARIFTHLSEDRAAANLGLKHAKRAGESEESEATWGKEEEKEKCPWGSAQAFEKARFGEGTPRISLAQIWPGFAPFPSDLAQFGFLDQAAPIEAALVKVLWRSRLWVRSNTGKRRRRQKRPLLGENWAGRYFAGREKCRIARRVDDFCCS